MIELNYRDPRPIYEQIKDRFRRLMITGALAPGDRLPSIRELSTALAINPNTIQRAYRELEAEGYIYSISGKGSFAAEMKDVNSARVDDLLKNFDELVGELRFLGTSDKELTARIETLVAPGTSSPNGGKMK